ncbi:MAG: ISNCY family transposase [Candidatus Curtissbacteria bacterium]|nr:ISNCY family transposase [Candidatus Curtissbacteria bacterium]
MTPKEAKRYDVMCKLIAKKIDGTEAAKSLNLSVRQVKRIKAKVKKKKIKGVIHGNRGKPSNRQTDKKTITEARKQLKKIYHDFNPLLAQEKLLEIHKIVLSKETVRQLMIAEKLWIPRKKGVVKKFFWRERKDNYGEMQQFDGSYHNWFEGRNEKELGTEQCLLVAVDDANGTITGAQFETNEGVDAVFRFWREYLKARGLPISIYLDRFSTYKVNHKNAVDNKELMTQFERAMRQLDIRVIHAGTPQAKGRVEKMNGTLQRRLVKELRLAKINTITEANTFLKETFIPKFNKQFQVVAKKPNDLHRDLTDKQRNNLDKIFSIQTERRVNNDYTVRFKNNYFQLNKIQPTTVCKKDRVIIEEHLDGEIKIACGNKYLTFVKLPERPKKVIDVKLIALTKQAPSEWKPPENHPWRKEFLINKKQPVKMAIN